MRIFLFCGTVDEIMRTQSIARHGKNETCSYEVTEFDDREKGDVLRRLEPLLLRTLGKAFLWH